MRPLSLLMLALLAVPALAARNPEPEDLYEQADAAFFAKDCAKARSLFEQAAAAGHGGAMYRLGSMYLLPQQPDCPVKHDDAKAFSWFTKAAAAGDARAMTNLGVMASGGIGTKRDGKAAAAWYRKAAQRGDERATLNLAAEREGAKDYAEARRLYEQVSRESDGDEARAAIGDLYRDGHGVAKDQKEAERWYSKAGFFGEARLKHLPPCAKAKIGEQCAP